MRKCPHHPVSITVSNNVHSVIDARGHTCMCLAAPDSTLKGTWLDNFDGIGFLFGLKAGP